ncbi:TATA box-binding protein-associated factor RNA polymerase I subunit B isoform 1-T3 [Menidia menidia]
MDEEETAGFRESCPQCGALDWSLSEEGGFYCRGCYGAIERTREVLDPSLNRGTSRISTLGRGSRTRKQGSGWMWRVCEGFQFILSRQAEALQALGACDWSPGLKDGVLGPLWRLYLQKSRQAFPSQGGASDWSRTFRREMEAEIELDSGAETSILSGLTDSEGNPPSSPPTDQGGGSGSLDGGVLKASGPGRMSMPKTLALLYLSLMWSREGLTLSDLLRLVRGDLVPYLKAYLLLPEEMQLFGKDAAIFHVQGVPSHRAIQQEAQNLVHFLQLPAFPPISRQCLIHPALLSQRYLTDLNLPDELHVCVCGLMERTHLDEPLTFDPESQPVLPAFDLLAAALVIVAMKAAFGLDDHAEWELSNAVSAKNDPGLFSLRRWFRLVETALIRVQQQEEQQLSRKSWRPDTHIVSSRRQKYTVIKLKRTADQVQTCFRRLSSGGGAPPGGGLQLPVLLGGGTRGPRPPHAPPKTGPGPGPGPGPPRGAVGPGPPRVLLAPSPQALQPEVWQSLPGPVPARLLPLAAAALRVPAGPGPPPALRAGPAGGEEAAGDPDPRGPDQDQDQDQGQPRDHHQDQDQGQARNQDQDQARDRGQGQD